MLDFTALLARYVAACEGARQAMAALDAAEAAHQIDSYEANRARDLCDDALTAQDRARTALCGE